MDGDGGTAAGRAWSAVGLAVLRRPRLWPEAVRQARLLLRPGGRAWLRFRMVTAYGDAERVPDAADVVTWLAWSRECVRPGRSVSN